MQSESFSAVCTLITGDDITSAAFFSAVALLELRTSEIAFSELNAGSTIPASIFAMRDWLTPASRASLACVIPS